MLLPVHSPNLYMKNKKLRQQKLYAKNLAAYKNISEVHKQIWVWRIFVVLIIEAAALFHLLTSQPSSSQRNLQLLRPLHFRSAAIHVASSQSYSSSEQPTIYKYWNRIHNYRKKRILKCMAKARYIKPKWIQNTRPLKGMMAWRDMIEPVKVCFELRSYLKL